MLKNKQLQKEGIQIIETLDTLTINAVAKTVSRKLVKAFPNLDLSEADLFISLSRLNMYVAKLPSDLSSAKYDSENHSIYFGENVDLSHIDTCVIHECLHALQEVRNESGELLNLGFCDFTKKNLRGIALNEASVQLMSSHVLKKQTDTVRYFDMTITTVSPSYYPLECSLVSELLYITGNYPLFYSTLHGDSLFKEKLTGLTNPSFYNTFVKNLDNLMELEDKLNLKTSYISYIDNEKEIAKINMQISKLRTKIQNLFLDTQNLILTTYFDKKFNTISTFVQIEDYRKKLYNFKNLIGYTDDYSFYNDYYIHKMADLEIKHNEIENHNLNINNTLLLTNNKVSLFAKVLKSITKLWTSKEALTKTDY